MKKLLLSTLVLGSCLLLASCGSTNEDATIQGLNNQLDRLNNVASNSVMISSNELNLSNYKNQNGDLVRLSHAYQKTEAAVSKQNDLREKILQKTATIKSKAKSENICAAENMNAVKELTSSLSKYTTKLANTNNEYRRTAKTISRMKNNTNTLTVDLNSKYTRLSSCAETRSCYLTNLLSTLDELDAVLGCKDETSTNQIENINTPQTKQEFVYDSTGKWIKGAYTSNGNCYDENGLLIFDTCRDENGNILNPNYQSNIEKNNNERIVNDIANRDNIPQNTPMENGNYMPPINENRPNNMYYNNGYYPNSGFNPNRNTDTYAPNFTNIDTYRNFGYNNGVGYNNGLNRNFNYNNRGLNVDATMTPPENNEDIKEITEPLTDNLLENKNKDFTTLPNLNQDKPVVIDDEEIDTLEEKQDDSAKNDDKETLENLSKDIKQEETQESTSIEKKQNDNNLLEDGRNDVNPKRLEQMRLIKKVDEPNKHKSPVKV